VRKILIRRTEKICCRLLVACFLFLIVFGAKGETNVDSIKAAIKALVNMDAILSFTDTEVQVENTDLPISRSYREAFIKQFNFR